MVLVAPAVQRLSAPHLAKPDTKHDIESARQVLIIQGDQDEVVPLQTVLDWAAPQELPVVVVPGAEHFFTDRLHILKRIVLEFMLIRKGAGRPAKAAIGFYQWADVSTQKTFWIGKLTPALFLPAHMQVSIIDRKSSRNPIFLTCWGFFRLHRRIILVPEIAIIENL